MAQGGGTGMPVFKQHFSSKNRFRIRRTPLLQLGLEKALFLTLLCLTLPTRMQIFGPTGLGRFEGSAEYQVIPQTAQNRWLVAL